jgi:hypothetical protein
VTFYRLNLGLGCDYSTPRNSTVFIAAEKISMSTNDNNAATAGTAPTTDPSLAQAQTQSTQVAQPTVGGNELICQWQGCGERQPTPEQLYVSLR